MSTEIHMSGTCSDKLQLAVTEKKRLEAHNVLPSLLLFTEHRNSCFEFGRSRIQISAPATGYADCIVVFSSVPTGDAGIVP
jgi:hypothetical protein